MQAQGEWNHLKTGQGTGLIGLNGQRTTGENELNRDLRHDLLGGNDYA